LINSFVNANTFNNSVNLSVCGKLTYKEFLDVKDFGAIGNGIVDDYTAIQNAIDAAGLVGAKVIIPTGTYNVSTTLIIPAGVIIQGEGRGTTSTNTPYSGSVIRNTSINLTISITGQNAGMRDLVVYDTDNAGAAGGIEILADGVTIESVILERILIFGFTDGIALKLESKNAGGISYCSFYDIRIRHAKTGILIKEDTTSFVNSNSFFHGAISGGGFDYCLHVLGGNNNVFNAIVIEPYTSIYGHLVVESGEIYGNKIRIEGDNQPETTPLIEFKSGASGSTLTGHYSGGLTINMGDNFIDLKSGKSLGYKNSNNNLFLNSCFNGIASNSIPYWEVSGTGITIESLSAEILPGYQVVKLTIPAGIDGYLRPSAKYLPSILLPAKYDRVNFGAYIKTDKPNAITTLCNAPAGVTTGLYHPGDSLWHMVGMTSLVNRLSSYNPKFHITNSNSSTALEIYITTPTLNFGNTYTELEAKSITSAGGIITGTLTTSMVSVPTDPSGFLTLLKTGNVFEVNGTDTIIRINYLTSNIFPKGTIITLLFNDANANVVNGDYIQLVKAFISTANGSLTLISLGNGAWREINRNS